MRGKPYGTIYGLVYQSDVWAWLFNPHRMIRLYVKTVRLEDISNKHEILPMDRCSFN